VTTSTLPGDREHGSEAPASKVRAASAEPELLDHEYDGIREYDNPMPGWWVTSFWLSVVFAVGYAFHYHASGNGVSVSDAYASEMAAARAEQAKRSLGERVSEDSLKKLMLDGTTLADAKLVFTQRCAVCHGDRGQGVIGPNLTDDHWLHGAGTLLDVHRVIAEGVPAKGMPAWNLQLSPVEVRQLAALVGSFHGQNLPGKAPEGTRAAR
jgi:cytochrome c oxidase cbb3-type subunit 3